MIGSIFGDSWRQQRSDSMNRPTRQPFLLHVSDLHFGSSHRFSPPRTVDGDLSVGRSAPSLLDSLSRDLDAL